MNDTEEFSDVNDEDKRLLRKEKRDKRLKEKQKTLRRKKERQRKVSG